MHFTLVILGRPNVGKSLLFNRLIGKKMAIVEDTPGVTRDWREAEGHLFNRPLRVIDTAGLEEAFDDSIAARMRRQTEKALEIADAVLFMIDGRAGVTPLDEHFASWVRGRNIPVLLGVNKCENDRATMAGVAESYALGLGDPIMLSAAHGIGLDQLYDALTPYYPDYLTGDTDEDDDQTDSDDDFIAFDAIEGDDDFVFDADDVGVEIEETEKPIKLAIVGRPNVGKSTLMNALLQEDRVMTGAEAGITRDAIAAHWVYKDREFRLVDTAGMRKKAKVHNSIERLSVDDTLRAIRLAQVVVLVIDANSPLEKQDLSIADHILQEGRALIIAINKWDTIEDKKGTLDAIQYRLQHGLAQVENIPLVAMSALTGKNIHKIMDHALSIYKIWSSRVRTGGLNRWLRGMESRHPAPMVHGRPNRLRYIAQIKTKPPTFIVWCSRPDDLPETYKRYLMNHLRKDFDLNGIPLRIIARTSKNPYVK